MNTLLEKAKNELELVINFLIQNPYRKIILTGHADYIGSETYNDSLSELRVESVANYLISNGIEKERIVICSRGENEPIDSDKTEKATGINRRVEFIIQ